MRTILHISDLHFGMIYLPTLDPLRRLAHALRPDVVVVSGDLTQRAREHQFLAARAFLDSLPQPQVVTPGNHDVPAYNLYRRLLHPLDRYRRLITPDLSPRYVDEEIAVLTVNTARSLVIKGGAISAEQLRYLEADVRKLAGQVKILVGHHPFDLPEGLEGVEVVDGIETAMPVFARLGIDMFLAGHLHLAYVGNTARYQVPDYHVPVFQAGTTTSTRARGEPNSCFVHRVHPGEIVTDTHTWDRDKDDFILTNTVHHPVSHRA